MTGRGAMFIHDAPEDDSFGKLVTKLDAELTGSLSCADEGLAQGDLRIAERDRLNLHVHRCPHRPQKQRGCNAGSKELWLLGCHDKPLGFVSQPTLKRLWLMVG